jgi:DNA-binding MarR family transcriptional regulator
MSPVNQDNEPLHTAAQVVAACRRLHASIDALDQAAASMLEVSRSDLRCLNLLEHGPVTPKMIGERLSLTSGSVTALIDRLERKGLVARQPDERDRRGVRVCATPATFAQVGALYRSCADALCAAVAAYPPDEQAAAVRHLSDAATAWENTARSVPAKN